MVKALPMANAANPAAVPNNSLESAQVRAQLQLREMILAGELPGGARIAELSIVEKLGVSRTPIRAALMRLEQEGLLESLPNGGFAVRTLSERDVSEAIELRGTITENCESPTLMPMSCGVTSSRVASSDSPPRMPA